ncbi:MAG: tetratricopeptide repeat protein [Verrucomicrobia bacterium]|nr:tetratricopeptide repeat protein [Verrucomicrobiota bacterium]MBS0637942.1 tetratricopeptide repeat protein [Verrucomicrobiota bacterium]
MIPEERASDLSDKIDLEFQETARLFAQKKADDEICRPNQLLPKNALVLRYQKELEQEFTISRKEQQHGARVLAASLEELKKEAPDLFSDPVIAGIMQIARLSQTITEDEQKFVAHLAQGGTLQELAKVDDSVMEALYLGAKRLFDLRLYDDAADAFKFLCALNPKKYLFWHGLAHAEYMQTNYNKALNAFLLVCAANPADVASQVALSRCYEETGQSDKALEVVEQTAAQPESAHWGDLLQQEILRLKKRRG